MNDSTSFRISGWFSKAWLFHPRSDDAVILRKVAPAWCRGITCDAPMREPGPEASVRMVGAENGRSNFWAFQVFVAEQKASKSWWIQYKSITKDASSTFKIHVSTPKKAPSRDLKAHFRWSVTSLLRRGMAPTKLVCFNQLQMLIDLEHVEPLLKGTPAI